MDDRADKPLLDVHSDEEEVSRFGSLNYPVVTQKNRASVVVSAFNLANTMIGLGTVTIPFAFKNAGVLWGCVLLMLVIAAGNHSYRQLARCSEMTGVYSFKEVAEHAFGGEYHGGVIAQITVAFYATGSCIAYIRVFGDYLPFLVRLVFPSARWLDDKLCMVLITLIFCLPMAAQKTMEKLKFASYLAIFGVCCTVIALSAELIHLNVSNTVNWAAFPGSIAMAFPLFSVSNTGHHNMLRLYKELEDRTESRVKLFVGIANGICLVFYGVVGIAGYLALGNFTTGNVLLGYDHMIGLSSYPFFYWLVQFAKFWLLVAIICSFPMPHFAVRCSVEAILDLHAPTAKHRWITTISLVTIMLTVALFVPGITDVFDVSGSTVGMIVVYIMPPLFVMRLDYLQQSYVAPLHFVKTHIASILVMIFGFSMSLWLLIWTIL